jgi:aspartyl-tRNA(Asn)/glutamyl-tRNA(Gln) amidotransferase subunit C
LRKDSPIAISREEVLHVAQLAQLALSEDEIERLTDDLGKILEAVSVVSELELEDVPPTSHPLDLVNVGDEDVPREPLLLEDVFANAPAEEAGQFRVPPWRQ